MSALGELTSTTALDILQSDRLSHRFGALTDVRYDPASGEYIVSFDAGPVFDVTLGSANTDASRSDAGQTAYTGEFPAAVFGSGKPYVAYVTNFGPNNP